MRWAVVRIIPSQKMGKSEEQLPEKRSAMICDDRSLARPQDGMLMLIADAGNTIQNTACRHVAYIVLQLVKWFLGRCDCQ